MKKYLFLFFAVCAVVLVACSDDDDDKYIMPQLSPNNTNIIVTASGGEKTITVSNAVDLNITQINNKEKGANDKISETNVLSIKNGKLKDSKNVTEGGWFTAKIVDKKIVIKVTENTDTENARDKYIHVSCGGSVYGLSLYLKQDKPASKDK